jgi:hypothetical protein
VVFVRHPQAILRGLSWQEQDTFEDQEHTMSMQSGSPQAPPPQQQAEPARMSITPVPGSLLEELLDQQHAARAAADEAAERVKSLTDRIKAELTTAHPGVPGFEIAGTAHRPPLRLAWVRTVRLDTQAMKKQEPETYVRFALFGGHWVLTPARGGL